MSTSLSRYDATISRNSFPSNDGAISTHRPPSSIHFRILKQIENKLNPFKIKKGKEEISGSERKTDGPVTDLNPSGMWIACPPPWETLRMWIHRALVQKPGWGIVPEFPGRRVMQNIQPTQGEFPERVQLLTGIV